MNVHSIAEDRVGPLWLSRARIAAWAFAVAIACPDAAAQTDDADDPFAGWTHAPASAVRPPVDSGIAAPTDRTVDASVDALVLASLSYVGVPYRRGGESPQTGFDCSGLVRTVFDRTWGLALPRRSEHMAAIGTPVQRDGLRPGDLVFFDTQRRRFSHIGIYLGDGRFVHAPASGGFVRVESLELPYWRRHWNGARRVAPVTAVSGT